MQQNIDHLITQLITVQGEEFMGILQELARSEDPIQSPREYELLATRVATETPHHFDLLRSIAEEQSSDEVLKLFAAVTAASFCRRTHQQQEGRRIIELVRSREREIPLLRHIRALSHLECDLRQLRTGISLEEEVYRSMPDNPGVAHGLAVFIVDIVEASDKSTADEKIKRQLERAIELTDKAIRAEQRPRFYYTRARINRRLGDFSTAQEDLAEAIEQEDRRASDYRERIANYLVERLLVDVDQRMQELRAQSEEMQQKLDKIEVRTELAMNQLQNAQLGTLEAIAFFSSILAIIQFSALTLSRNYSLTQAVILILALGSIIFSAVFMAAWALRRSRR